MLGQVAESVMFPSHFVEIIMFGKRCTLVSFTRLQAGLDMGIVNAGMLAVYDEIDPVLKKKVESVVLNKSKSAGEDLLAYAEKIKDQNEVENRKGQIYHGGKNR